MSTLNKYEMAALTAQVPVTDDTVINKIITTSLRLKIAAQFMEGILASGREWEPDFAATEALKFTDALLGKFEGK